MKKNIALFLAGGLIAFVVVCYAATVLVINAAYDQPEIAAPANPASGFDRVYMDSTTHKWTCLTSAGASCAPSGGGGGGGMPTIKQGFAIRSNGLTTASFPLASAQNDIVVAAVAWEAGAATASTLTDSASTSYTKVCEVTGRTNENIAMYVGTLGASPGTLTFTIGTPAGSDFQALMPIEFTGGITAAVDTCAITGASIGNTQIALTPGISNAVIVSASILSNLVNPLGNLAFSTINAEGLGAMVGVSLTTPLVGVPMNISLRGTTADAAYAAVSFVQ